MYDVDELIDHIRTLEGSRLSEVYILLEVRVPNFDEASSYVRKVYPGKDQIPSQEVLIRDLLDEEYDMYLDNLDNCCGGDTDCCGKLDREDFESDRLSVYSSSYYNQALERSENMSCSYTMEICTISDEYSEVITTLNLIKSPISYT